MTEAPATTLESRGGTVEGLSLVDNGMGRAEVVVWEEKGDHHINKSYQHARTVHVLRDTRRSAISDGEIRCYSAHPKVACWNRDNVLET
jgi:hypothetical protein